MWRVRLAMDGDLPALRELIPLSVRTLSGKYYSPEQIESSIRHVFGVDTQLLADRTYFVNEYFANESVESGIIAGCGGWSRRRTLFGGDQMKAQADPLLDPATNAARIRAFFVHPAWVRRGVGTHLMMKCVEAIEEAGFRRMELAATLPGEPLYRHWGFEVIERFDQRLPDGVVIPFVRMGRTMPPAGEEFTSG